MSIPVQKIAEFISGEISGDPDKNITGAAPFESAGPADITCAAEHKYLKQMENTGAGVVIVPKTVQSETKSIIRVDNPRAAFARVMGLFWNPAMPSYLKYSEEIHPSTILGNACVIGKKVALGPCVVIGDRVRIGDGSRIHSGAVIGDDVRIGEDVEIFPNVTILAGCHIGNRVRIQSATVIGSDGFGFAPEGKKWVKVPQMGIVEIGDDVEIGAANTIDRATFGKTVIGNGVKTDNLVHIAHNVVIGDDSLIIAQAGISGSVTLGKHVILAGQVGVAGHVTIGNDVTAVAQTGIAKSVSDGEVISGSPHMPHKIWLKVSRILPMLPDLKKKISRLEKRLAAMEKE